MCVCVFNKTLITEYRLLITYHLITDHSITDHQLQITYYRSPITEYLLPKKGLWVRNYLIFALHLK